MKKWYGFMVAVLFMSLITACGGGTSASGSSKTTSGGNGQYGIYTFYETIEDLRDYTFLDGYVMRKQGAGCWKDFEKSEGVYDFSGMDAVIKEIAPTGKKLSFLITNAASREPVYIASHSGVTTYSYNDHETGEFVTRAVPWDAYQLERFEAFAKALANHEIDGVAFKNHPTVANIALGIPGINQGYRSREVQFKDMPGYDREKFRDAIIKSLHIAVDNMPDKNHYLGAWKEKDDIASPELGDYLAQEIISEFGSKIMFWNENLAAKIVSGVVSGSPKCDFASPLCNSKDKTPIGFQMLQGWICPFANPDATSGGATPSDGIQYAYDTFNAQYFEVYMCDLDNSAYWEGLQKWHDKLEPD
ncbi:MAG: hypothetical protein HZC10_04665 [Nitrospirae bacterium]|nr:hypothetical protein [Nitrospirota bacterium]